jgi:hypothetical protein
MTPTDVKELPNLEVILGGLVARVAPARQPLLIAIAERLAAARYRDWAQAAGTADGSAAGAAATRADQLLACARREEEIAARVEALYPDAAAIQADIGRDIPELGEINRSIFAGRPLPQQFAIQARAERLGAATWRAFAAQDTVSARRDTFLACADLEEQSALVLEKILG